MEPDYDGTAQIEDGQEPQEDYYGECSSCGDSLGEEDDDICWRCWSSQEFQGSEGLPQPLNFTEG